jgi:5,10-methylenetetrahydrofolate reductase
MLEEVGSYTDGPLFQGYPEFRAGTVVRPGKPLAWRKGADFIFVQVTYELDRLLAWRENLDYEGRMYAAVLVLGSSRMAQRINAALSDIRIPSSVIDKLDDPAFGIDLACEQIAAIEGSGAFDGVHLVPVSRYREIAGRLPIRHGER